MYKTLLFIILIMLSTAIGAVEWYESGPGGYIGRRISSGDGAHSGWSLAIEEGDSGESRTLYENDKVHSTALLTRVDGQLLSWIEQDADGKLLSKTEYMYDADGTPRISYIATESADSTNIYVESYAHIHANGPSLRNEYGAYGDWTITNMEEVGQPVDQIVYADGEEVSTQKWIWSGDGYLLQDTIFTGESFHERRFDSHGHLLEEQTVQGNIIVLTRTYTWDENNLIRVIERGEGTVLSREIGWLEDEMSHETYYVDGLKTRKIEWTLPGEKVETLFRNGNAIMRVYWVDDRRLREEFLRSGAIYRIREILQ